VSTGQLLSELDRLGVELRAHGGRLRYAGPEEALTPELLDRLKAHKAELLSLSAWDEDEAYKLIKDALDHLCEQYQKTGGPDFDPATLNDVYDRIDEAYEAEDMGQLRCAVRALVVARLKEFDAAKRSVA
jgi:hypothetical protein